MSNSPAVVPPQQTIRSLLEAMKPKLADLMPKHLTPDRLIKVALNCIAKVPLLQQCTAASLLQSIVTAAELGLEPGGALGHAYLVPFKGVCQLMIGYRGFIELARRSGQLSQIEAHVVHERDDFKVEFGLTPVMRHVPKLDGQDPGKPVLVYMLARLREGAIHCEVMPWADVMKIKARSRSSNNGPWVTDEEEMAKKTVVRRGMKYMPLSAELARAIEVDDEDAVVDGQVGRNALPSDTALAQEVVSNGNERAKAALAAKQAPSIIVDVQSGETEEQAAARAQPATEESMQSPI